MWVVKLGGSLVSDPPVLRRWLEVLATDGAGRVVIVPGGGPFADLARESQAALGFSDAAAHRMAIFAMGQFAAVLAGLAPEFTCTSTEREIREVLGDGGIAMWLPAAMTLGHPEIPESWDVTSDSLAAWLARRLNAERLVLVKSCAVPEGEAPPEELRRRGIVDAAFPQFMRGARFPARTLNKLDHQALRDSLAGRPPE